MEDKIIKNLSWNAPLDCQKNAIDQIASMDNLNPITLLQPSDKECWENAAKVLYKIGYPKIEPAIPGLFAWLQDSNWPGEIVVKKILKSLPKDIFILHFESAVKEAIRKDDEEWLMNLADFLTSLKLEERDFISNEVYLALFRYR